eukprot:CAMPEP_0184020118 /NCGR_PEP_ID=MMETSP0954-20121128/9164_1 /TAXON_ID=627963 /ORGANISM="Aplanochytrium sp, Strain PBS07" /LENGTH=463 /DNA_ID=CAMNT_0026301929 /DNA_START=115 /DNA_END=1503 /DNA_ORIENTATION=+
MADYVTDPTPSVVVIGAGVVGVTTAYYLAKSGLHVTVLERGPGVAYGSSFANAGRFVPSEIVNYPPITLNSIRNIISKSTSSLFREKKEHVEGDTEAEATFRPSTSVFRFGYHVLKGIVLKDSAKENALFVKLSNLCNQTMLKLYDDEQLDNTEKSTGNLWLYGSKASFTHSGVKSASVAAENGYRTSVLSLTDCAMKFPFLKERISSLQNGGCVVAHDDWTADARIFTQSIAASCEKLGNNSGSSGVKFHFNQRVKKLLLSKSNGKLISSGVQTDDGNIYKADAVVICCGVQSGHFIKQFGYVGEPIVPMKGCSIELYGVKNGPTMTVADKSSSFSYQISPFKDGRVRIVGFADFDNDFGEAVSKGCPNGVVCRENYKKTLLEHTRKLCPEMTWSYVGKPWCGVRPMSPDCLPILGLAPSCKNVFLNCGHGAVGWTFSAGTSLMTAKMVASSLSGFTPKKEW